MTEDSIEIIRMLREARLGWIADELVEALALGRQTVKEFREPGSPRTTKATTIEPFSSQDEMEIIVETLAQYFIVMPAAWATARKRFARKDTFSQVPPKEWMALATNAAAEQSEDYSVVLGIAGDDDSAFQEFSVIYQHKTLPAMRTLLAKLWPFGPADFVRRFMEEDPQQP